MVVAAPGTAASLPHGGRFVALDSLRGLAALAIAWRHINGNGPFLSGAAHDNLRLGVDFFFVLSGFVIAASYGDRLAAGFSTVRFMALRIGRVWPLHAAMVAGYIILELVFAAAGSGGILHGREPFTGPRDPWTLPGVLLLVQALVWPGRDLWNVQSWSISVEVWLYLAAALLWRWIGARAWLPAAVAALVALAILGMGGGSQEWLLRGIGGFGLGMAVRAAWQAGWIRRLSPAALTALELSALPAAVALLLTGASVLVADLVFAAVILVFARESGPVSAVLRSAALRWLGTVSYSLYMVHGLVFGRIFDGLSWLQGQTGARWVSAQLGGADRILLPTLAGLLVALAMIAAVLPIAWLAWRCVEWPARNWSRHAATRLGASDEERAATAL